MKELSIEEKAQAYDKALQRAKHALDCDRNNLVSTDIPLIYSMFPELKESEDDKIRKEILELVRQSSEVLDKQNQNNMIAWLEKQGEHANFLSKIQVGDKVTRNEGGVLVNISQLERVAKSRKVKPKFKVKYAGKEYNVLEIKESADITYYGIEDEPNHIDYVKAENCDIISSYVIKENSSPYLTKLAEWSEEDEEHIDSLLKRLDGLCRSKFEYTRFAVSEDIDWLKSLKQRIGG